MAIAAELQEQVTTLTSLLGDEVCAEELPGTVMDLDDDQVLNLLRQADRLMRGAERVRIVASGVVSTRSKRAAGHAGLAQKNGHRSTASLIQEMTGSSRSDAAKEIRVGEALLGATGGGSQNDTADDDVRDDESRDQPAPPRPWHAPLSDALMAGKLTKTQHAAILRGLGEPPASEGDPSAKEESDAVAAAIREAWRRAAEQLIEEASARTVEELGQQARTIRDRLDPEGAARRFHERYEQRSFRTWSDADGRKHARIDFDDEAYEWVRSMVDAAMRPRLGGPRFVDPDEKKSAGELVDDPRNNDQLTYDLIIDLLRAGSLADAATVFGTRQAGVRLMHVQGDTNGGHTEDGLVHLPAALIDQRICDTSTVDVTVDSCGNPLDVGREHRLFTPRQRTALAIRDGGCRWHGCDRPASYCEAHHIDEWHADHGRTDIDRGILLCRYHHMQLHHGGWRITRAGKADFLLHPPGGAPPVPLRPRLALRYAWDGIAPPAKRFRPAA
ncbi:MAG: DUF222 domain-containing protein [Microbacterium sp.]